MIDILWYAMMFIGIYLAGVWVSGLLNWGIACFAWPLMIFFMIWEFLTENMVIVCVSIFAIVFLWLSYLKFVI